MLSGPTVRLNDKFPKDPPAVYVLLPFDRDLASSSATSDPALVDAGLEGATRLDNVPYSPRWAPDDMVARFVYDSPSERLRLLTTGFTHTHATRFLLRWVRATENT